MGVDLKLFVVADYGPYVEHVITMDRDRGLWKTLQEIEDTKKQTVFAELQLPAAAFSNSNGYTPDELKESERGHVQENEYGGPLVAVKSSELAGVKSAYSDFNTEALAFVAKHFSRNLVVLWWC